MGATDIKVTGYPKNLVRGSDFSFSPGCGGMGAGACYLPASFRYIWWRVYATNFVVRNRKLTLQNIDFKSYANAGSDGFCPNSNGASQDYDILLVYQADGGIFVEADVTARVTVSGSQTLPFEVTFEGDKIPQPTSPSWTGIFYVVVDLKETGRMLGGRPATLPVLSTVNYDYDERL